MELAPTSPTYHNTFLSITQIRDIFKDEILTQFTYQDIARLCQTCKGLYFNETLLEKYRQLLTEHLQNGGKLYVYQEERALVERAAEIFIAIDDSYESTPDLDSYRNFLWKASLPATLIGIILLLYMPYSDNPTNLKIAGGLIVGLSSLAYCTMQDKGELCRPFRYLAERITDQNESTISIAHVEDLIKHQNQFALSERTTKPKTPTESSALLAPVPGNRAQRLEENYVSAPSATFDLDPLFPNEMTILDM